MSTEYQRDILSQDPLVYIIDNYITDEECEHMKKIAIPTLKQSYVSSDKGGTVSSGRTSKNTWIGHDTDDITKSIAQRTSELVKLPMKTAESFQVVHYGETNEYRAHYDSWDHNGSEKTLRCIKYGGPRLLTALVYLNDVEEGGSTRFCKLDINVEPKKGRLLVFQNTINGSIDKHILSEHAGMPVIKGEKYIFNLWYRECERTKLYSDHNPEYYVKLNASKVEERPVAESKVKMCDIKPVANTSNLIMLNSSKMIQKTEGFIETDDALSIIQNTTFVNGRYENAWIKTNVMPHFTKSIEQLFSVDSAFFESMNVIKYSPNQIHGPFFDASDLKTDVGKKNTAQRGQRLYTIVVALTDNIEYSFAPLKTSILMKRGTVLSYKNVTETKDRDISMEHRIRNNNSSTGYIMNIYLREKDLKGRSNPILTTFKENIVLETTPKVVENYHTTFNEVLSYFKEDKVSMIWKGHKSFKYTFRGDFNYFKKCIQSFEKFHMDGSALNKDTLTKQYTFDEYNPVVLKDVVKEPLLDLLKAYYRKTIEEKVFPLGDRQSNRFKAHNEPMSRFLQYEILPLVERITGKELYPTYTYLSSYVNDSDLPAHTDREDCEFTVSFLVNKDADWPIYLHKTKQPTKYKGRHGVDPDISECIELHGDVGGLIIFSGTDHLHFRKKFTGNFYDIVLLHYRVKE